MPRTVNTCNSGMIQGVIEGALAFRTPGSVITLRMNGIQRAAYMFFLESLKYKVHEYDFGIEVDEDSNDIDSSTVHVYEVCRGEIHHLAVIVSLAIPYWCSPQSQP